MAYRSQSSTPDGADTGVPDASSEADWTDVFNRSHSAIADGRIFLREFGAVALAEAEVSKIALLRFTVCIVVAITLLGTGFLLTSAVIAYVIAVLLGAGWLVGLLSATAISAIGTLIAYLVAMNYAEHIGFSHTRQVMKEKHPRAVSDAGKRAVEVA